MALNQVAINRMFQIQHLKSQSLLTWIQIVRVTCRVGMYKLHLILTRKVITVRYDRD